MESAQVSFEASAQRAYYARTASSYDTDHLAEGDEHYFALAWLTGTIDYLGATSILDVGAGTGRSMAYLRKRCPALRIAGIEPVAELREVAYAKGIDPSDLTDGDAISLKFDDGAFDIVCAFAVLHHIRYPDKAISEMLRVAKKAVFLSDSNNFGQGSALARSTKQVLRAARLWKAADWVKTRGKGYTVSDGDGLAYSFSLFDHYPLLRASSQVVHVLNTGPASTNLYRTAGHVAMLAIK